MANIDINGTRVHYRSSGDSSSDRVAIFVHAYLLDSRLWLDQLQALEDMRHCIAIDLPGFGQSDSVTRRKIEPESYADDLVDFIHALGIENAVDWVGFSGGAILAAMMQRRVPEMVSSLVLLSSQFTSGPDETYRRYQAEMARLVVVEGKDALFRRFDEYIFGDNPDLLARARYKTMLDTTDYEMFVAFLTSQALRPRPELLQELDKPVLFPVGEKDVIATPEHMQKLAADIPRATVVTLPQGGRLLPLECPQRLSDAIRDFWSVL